MANRNFANGGKIWAMHVYPVLIDLNFIVDSANGNGLGIRSLKGPLVESVFMSSNIPAPGAPNMGSASSFAVLGASAVSNTGSSVLAGNLGIYPGTSITGFPPGTFTGAEDIANAAAQNAQNSALAAYTMLAGHSTTVIPSALDGQTLSPGYYSFSSGAATLALSAPGTLTLDAGGNPNALFVIKTATTYGSGAGGAAVISLINGAQAKNVFFIVGSSATINQSGASVHEGNIIAQASITSGGGTAVGSLIALTGAVTISAAMVSGVAPGASGSMGPGIIGVQLQDNYNRYLGGFSGQVSPLGASSGSIVKGQAYVITSLGSATPAQWVAAGVPSGVTPSVGLAFLAALTESLPGSAQAAQTQPAGSGIDHIEIIGDPNLALSSVPQGQSIMYLQCYSNGVKAAPADGSVIGLALYLNNSSVQLAGE